MTATAAHPARSRRRGRWARRRSPGLTAAAFPLLSRLDRRARTGTLVFVVLAFITAYLRLSPGAAGSIWAEDGTRFLSGELLLGFPASVTEPYAGYMHLLPRLVGLVAGTLPLVLANDVFALAASAVVALSATATLVLSRGHLPYLPIRLGLAGMVVLLPSAGLEAAGNTANSHWFLMAAAFWALAARPSGRGEVVLAAALVVLAAGSDPLTVLLAPLALARLLLLRGWRDHVVAAALVLTSLVQGLVVLGTERAAGEPSPGTVDVLASYSARVPLVLLAGLEGAPALFDRLGWLAPAGASAVLAAAGLLAVVRGPGRLRWLAVAAGTTSVAFYAATATISWSPALDPGEVGLDTSTHARYSLVPMLLLLAVAAAALQAVADRGRRGLLAVAGTVVGLTLVATVIGSFRPEPDLRSGPSWDSGVLEAARVCQTQPQTTTAEVALAPGTTWVVGLPCAELR